MYTYEELWALLNPKEDYDQLKGKCRILWNSFSIEKRQYIYCRIEEKKKRKEFVDYNPLFAIRKNSTLRPQILSFDEYYARYGTTEEKDGWTKKFLPEERKTIYVKPA